MKLRHAICSEIFQGWDLKKICSTVKPMGYDGLEIAHFHLFENVADLSADQRAEMRRTIEGEGMVCSGLHWLLVSPKGFHITTPDAELRRRSWDYLARLIDFCGDLGGSVMIFGSPYQRSTLEGMTIAEAKDRLVEGLAGLAPRAQERDVALLMEAIPRRETNVITTLSEAAEIVRRVNHPAVQTMFDAHNTADETEPPATLLEKFYPIIRHVHVNEMDGRHPGTGDFDFTSVLKYLTARDYKGWVSLEVFDFKAGSKKIARDSINFLGKTLRDNYSKMG